MSSIVAGVASQWVYLQHFQYLEVIRVWSCSWEEGSHAYREAYRSAFSVTGDHTVTLDRCTAMCMSRILLGSRRLRLMSTGTPTPTCPRSDMIRSECAQTGLGRPVRGASSEAMCQCVLRALCALRSRHATYRPSPRRLDIPKAGTSSQKAIEGTEELRK